jgi:hypothetical protein
VPSRRVNTLGVRYVVIESTGTGFLFDPRPYEAMLPELLPQLPPGAARWASEPHHYRHWSDFCPRGLRLVGLSLDAEGDVVRSVAFVAAHGASRRTFSYTSPRTFRIEITDSKGRLADILGDEVLPHEDGCSHEVRFAGGTIHITATDLHVSWEGTDEVPDAQGLLAYQRHQ